MEETKKTLVYLACPYSLRDETKKHREDEIVLSRFHNVTIAAGLLIEKGYAVYSPITQSHMIKSKVDLPGDWTFWKEHDKRFIDVCDVLFVLMLEGYENSIGVNEEVSYALEQQKEIRFINFVDNKLTGLE
jgi:hypothetical protein